MRMKWIIALFCALSSSLWASADVSQFIRQRADGRYLALQEYLAACFKAGKKKITLPPEPDGQRLFSGI